MEDVNNSIKKKRIVKNTLMMYIRMFITMCISFYTSRLIIQALGVSDFGIYNVVGGMVTLFTFVNMAMLAATQRFLNYEIGQKNMIGMSEVFKTAYLIHIIIAAVIIIGGEIIGTWLINNKLQIPEESKISAMIVLQASILTCALQILTLPYNAVIIAHEHINISAFISIFECILKLGVSASLFLIPTNRLIYYAILLGGAQLVLLLTNWLYCQKHFFEVRGGVKIFKHRIKAMSQFAMWSLIGCASGVFSGQGLNILLGIFFQPVVNAARGIAVQIQSAVITFGYNLNIAMTPQITQSYSSGDLDFFFKILYYGSKYVFFLVSFVSIPIFLRTEYIINLWLGEVPQYTIPFIRWLILATLIEAVSTPLMRASDATGNIKIYQSIVGGILVLIAPISYLFLKLGCGPVSVFIVYFCVNGIAWLARLFILRKMIGLSISLYIKNVLLIVVSIFSISWFLSYICTQHIPNNFIGLMLTCLISTIITACLIYSWGLSIEERLFIRNKIFAVLKRHG